MSWNEDFERTLREERAERWRRSENTPARPEEPSYEPGIFLQKKVPPQAPTPPKPKDLSDHMEKLDDILEDDP